MQPLRNWFSSYFTPKPAPTTEALTSFDTAKKTKDPSPPEQIVSPQKTTAPTPHTSILKQTNPSDILPETVTALSTLKSWFSFLSNVTQAKDNSPAPVAEEGKTADMTTGKRKAPEPTSDNNPPQAKRAKTNKSPEEEAMKNLIGEEVVKRMAEIKIRDRTIKIKEETTKQVTKDFEQKRSKKDPLFEKLLENQIKLLAVQEQRTSNAKSKSGAGETTVGKSTQPPKAEAEKNNNAGSPQSYAELRLSRPLDLRSVRTMDKNELEQHNRDIQEKRRDKITNASKEAINTYLNSPQQALKREEERLAQLKESNNGLTSAASRAGPTVYNTRYTMPENGTEDGPQTGKRRLTKASDATGGMGKVLKEEGWIKTTRVNASRHGGPSPCAHAWREEIQAPQVRESGGKGKGGGGR